MQDDQQRRAPVDIVATVQLELNSLDFSDRIELRERLRQLLDDDLLHEQVVSASPPADNRPANESSRAPVHLTQWARDGGAVGREQTLIVDVVPGPLPIAKTQVASGSGLVSNGYLGADVIYLPAGGGFTPHTHRGDHLLLVIGGRGSVTVAGEIVETSPGDIYLVDGMRPHAVGAITDHLLLSVGVWHNPIDSSHRQETVDFDSLLSADGSIHCQVCGAVAGGEIELREGGCAHGPMSNR